MRLRRNPFADVIARQLDLFVEDEAEERYGDYLDLVETRTDLLADLRDHYASTLSVERAAEYEKAFDRAVRKRLPRFALQIEDS